MPTFESMILSSYPWRLIRKAKIDDRFRLDWNIFEVNKFNKKEKGLKNNENKLSPILKAVSWHRHLIINYFVSIFTSVQKGWYESVDKFWMICARKTY